jgi:4'-phosphopantetheinyl transferase
MSHSGSLAAFAFAQDCQVGIDIEERRALPDLDLFVQSHFSAAEQKAFAIVPPALQLQAFFNVWTRKEAFRKATGAGLTSALNNFSVSLETNASTSLVAAGRPWQVQPLPIEAGFAAALAYDGPPRAFSQQPPLEMEDLWQSWANPPL